MTDTRLLSRKAAVVTGSSRGLGRAFAVALAGAGAQVVINGTDSNAVLEVVDEIRRGGGRVEGCVQSVASMDGARRVIDTALERFGRLDILVNNAGVARDRTLLKMTEEDWDTVVDVHMKGTFACAKYAATHMSQQKSGRIINVTSGVALFGNFGQTNYAAAKGGILAMTLTWAAEMEPYGVTVNAVRASARTKMTEPILERSRQHAREAGQPEPTAAELGFFEPEAAAPLVVFLSSEQAQGITGQLFSIDGPRLCLWSRPRPVASAYSASGWTAESIQEFFSPIARSQAEPYCAAAYRTFMGNKALGDRPPSQK